MKVDVNKLERGLDGIPFYPDCGWKMWGSEEDGYECDCCNVWTK